MAKYTLICDHGDGHKSTAEFSDECLDDVLKNIDYFLRGASFCVDYNSTLSYNDSASQWRRDILEKNAEDEEVRPPKRERK